MKGYYKLRKMAFKILHSELSEKLYYHSADHTIKALKDCEKYLKAENIDSYSAKLLKIAILYHDIGFVISHLNHEFESVKIAIRLMTEYGCLKKDIEVVKGLIYATQIQRAPKTLLEEIIKDVDLDYLGRSDYYLISEKLHKEIKYFTGLGSEKDWYKKQIDFLKSHVYYTDFAIKNRQPYKEKRIQELKLKMLQ